MTNKVVTATPETPLAVVVRLMERHHIKRVPIVEDGKAVGIITRANLLRAIGSLANELPPSSAEDAHIREQLLAELKIQHGCRSVRSMLPLETG